VTGKENEAFFFKKVVPVSPRQLPCVVGSYGVGKKCKAALWDVVQPPPWLGTYLCYMKSRPLVMTHEETLLPSH